MVLAGKASWRRPLKKCALLLFSIALVGSCAFLLPSLFAWGEHKRHAGLVRQIAASSLTMPDGKERFSKRDWDEFVELYSYYPDWGGGGSSSPKRPEELFEYFLSAQVKYR